VIDFRKALEFNRINRELWIHRANTRRPWGQRRRAHESSQRYKIPKRGWAHNERNSTLWAPCMRVLERNAEYWIRRMESLQVSTMNNVLTPQRGLHVH
jgi:hypothetical protein